MNNVIGIKGAHEAPRNRRSSMETLIITQEIVNQWQLPEWQRPLRENQKVRDLAQEIKADGVAIPGVITLGRTRSSNGLYLVDGQHRIHAFRLSELPEALADVRIMTFEDTAEMSVEFYELNSRLAVMKPDDMLRAMEPTSEVLQRIHRECRRIVTYGQVRRGVTTGPVLSMSATIRCWTGTSTETPSTTVSGKNVVQLLHDMDDDSATLLIRFLQIAYTAWGGDKEYYRLWANLNLAMNMWLFRRLVIDKTRGVKRYVTLNDTQFRQCLQSISADSKYIDWLLGRQLGDRDRMPCYDRLKAIYTARLKDGGMSKPLMPQPTWAVARAK